MKAARSVDRVADGTLRQQLFPMSGAKQIMSERERVPGGGASASRT